jgi:hypothetical protein
LKTEDSNTWILEFIYRLCNKNTKKMYPKSQKHDFQTLEGQKPERNIYTNPTNSMKQNIENLSKVKEGREWTFWIHVILYKFEVFRKRFLLRSNIYWKIVTKTLNIHQNAIKFWNIYHINTFYPHIIQCEIFDILVHRVCGVRVYVTFGFLTLEGLEVE